MKSKLENLKKDLKSAFSRFDEVMNLPAGKAGMPRTEIVRDSAIQRFEFTFELLWKTMKAILEEKGAKDLYFPRDVLKEAFRAKLIDEDERWLDMLDSRNQTSDMYKESMAEKVYQSLPPYVDMIRGFVKNLP